MFRNDDWLGQHVEEVIDPDRDIIDPHHHLWPSEAMGYNLDELLSDLASGHKVVGTVFMECGAAYRKEGPEHLKCVGETAFIADAAQRSLDRTGHATILGLVAHADLRSEHLEEVLDAHKAAGNGLFRGIRHAAASDPEPALTIPGKADPDLFEQDAFLAGVARLGARNLTYDTWLYHHQLPKYRDLAAAIPGTTMILDHFGTPLGVGAYAGKREEIFAKWKDDIAAVAKCPNVYAKIGGMAMPDNGYGWHEAPRPPSSDDFVEAQADWYHHTIKCFGPDRCMFESNFPVDRLSLSYRTLWNALKKIGANYSAEEQDLMFRGVAKAVYRV